MSHPHSVAFVAARRRRRHLARLRRAERRYEERQREREENAARAWRGLTEALKPAPREPDRGISLRTLKILLWGSWVVFSLAYLFLVWSTR